MGRCKILGRTKVFTLALACLLTLTACGKTEEAQAVDDLISSIGEIEENSEKAIEKAEEAYSALTEDEKETLDNYASLLEARDALNQLKASLTEDFIRKIGTVDESSKSKITQARKSYDELNDEQQLLVTNYAVLADAEQEYEAIIDAKILEVEELIDSIGEVVFSDECRQAIKAAETAYNTLDVSYRKRVENGNLLTDARIAYNKLSPIQLNSYSLKKNIIGQPEFYLNAQNITDKIIKEFSVRVFSFDNDGVPVKLHFNDFTYKLTYTNALKPDGHTTSNSYWQLYGNYNEMNRIVVYPEEVEFYDGTTWENPQSNILYSRYNEKILEDEDENVLNRG